MSKTGEVSMKRYERRWVLGFLAPYVSLFAIFIVVPTVLAVLLSFTNFNTIQFPKFVGFKNYVSLFTTDSVFMQYVLPNTIKYALLVGPLGYALAFILAWMLAQLPRIPRTILALIIYSPSMTIGVAMQVIWLTIFSGDKSGYLNSLLINLGLIDRPIQWLQSPEFLFPTMVVVTLWSSMGVGFLAMLAGILNTDPEIYEAAYIDGVSKRWQEIFYVTIPLMKPQMLFGAVMAVVSTFQTGYIGVLLSGSNPTPQYAGQLIVNHIEDFGFLRFEMGYAAAISVVLLVMIWLSSKFVWSLFLERD